MKLAIFFGIVGGAAPARAEARCAGMTVDAGAGFRASWPGLLQRVRDELAARDDVDVCARVELRAQGREIAIDVTLPDGRTASRKALGRDDVLLTLEALLLVPEPATVSGAPATSATAEPPAVSQSPMETPMHAISPVPANRRALDHVSPEPTSAAARSNRIRIELSAIGGARIGNGQSSVGLGAVSFLDIGGWLIGFQGRADRYLGWTGGEPLTAFELALPLGKRFQLGSVALDVLAGPAVVMTGIDVSDTVRARVDSEWPPPEPPMRDTPAEPVPRLLVGARLGFSPNSVFRTFIGVDGEVGPVPSAATTRADALLLPAWTLGVALGGTVGTE